MSNIPPAVWQDPEAFEPDEVHEATEPDDGSFKRIAEEQHEAVEQPEEE